MYTWSWLPFETGKIAGCDGIDFAPAATTARAIPILARKRLREDWRNAQKQQKCKNKEVEA